MSVTFKLKANEVVRKKKHKKKTTPALDGCPFKRGNCVKVFLASPRKPNSAARRVAKLFLSSEKTTIAYCPGMGHNLQKHSTVLMRGGPVKDLPGIRYKMLRGKFDLRFIKGRIQGRSKYGTFKI